MAARLDGKIVAILATDGFEESELAQPMEALRNAGAEVEIIAPKDGQVIGKANYLDPIISVASVASAVCIPSSSFAS